MTIKSNPNDWVNKWKAGVGAAGAKYTSGVQNGNDWAAAATAPGAVNARNAGLQRAIADGTIDRGIQNLGTAAYKQATIAKAANWTNGVNTQQAQQNALNGANTLFGYLQNAESALASMPRGDFNTNMQRMQTWVTSIRNQAQARKGY